jgi:hypothetical protein
MKNNENFIMSNKESSYFSLEKDGDIQKVESKEDEAKNAYDEILSGAVISFEQKKNYTFPGTENRQVYLKAADTGDIDAIFDISDNVASNLVLNSSNWVVKIGDEQIPTPSHFLAIGTEKDFPNLKNENFYQFEDNGIKCISRVHCVLYFTNEYVMVVDLWSNNGTKVIMNNGEYFSSKHKNRKIIKLDESGKIELIRCGKVIDIQKSSK